MNARILALIFALFWAVGARAEVVEYVHTDALGSPVAITNESAQVIERTDYDPYGNPIGKTNNDRPGYTGHVMDSATGLTYMQQRYYDPGIGRFLFVDPVAANAGTGASFNRYDYANNNPYRFTDSDGRQAMVLRSQETPGNCHDSMECFEHEAEMRRDREQWKPMRLITVSFVPSVPSRIVATVTGETEDEVAKEAQKKILGEQRKEQVEYCGQICPAPNGGFQIVISTNDAFAACLAQVKCGGA